MCQRGRVLRSRPLKPLTDNFSLSFRVRNKIAVKFNVGKTTLAQPGKTSRA